MIIGATNTHVFELPLGAEEIQTIEITYAQNNIERLKKKTDGSAMQGNSLTVKLSQEESFLFSAGGAEIQIRVLTNYGEVIPSDVMHIHCQSCLSDEVLK